MANEIQIWAMDDSSSEAVQLSPKNQAETEKLLEETLVKQPNMLMPGLTLVGRQTPVAGGYLDLLGVGRDGRLIVFELKRGTLTRDAVTQVIDYASDLEARDFSDLSAHIAERSGKLGIDRIDNFEEWYSDRFEGQEWKPVRMALVGLGVDDNATRILKYLAERGVEIDLLTFHAYEHEAKTLLARQVELESVAGEQTPLHRRGAAEHRRQIEERIRGMEVSFWNDLLAGFRSIGPAKEHLRTNGFAFGRPNITLPGNESSFSVYQSVRAVDAGTIRVTFLPIAVHLCKAQFEEADESIRFKKEPPSNAPSTNKIGQQWYCVLDEDGWKEHGDTLLSLASSIYKAWDEARRGNFTEVETTSTDLESTAEAAVAALDGV